MTRRTSESRLFRSSHGEQENNSTEKEIYNSRKEHTVKGFFLLCRTMKAEKKESSIQVMCGRKLWGRRENTGGKKMKKDLELNQIQDVETTWKYIKAGNEFFHNLFMVSFFYSFTSLGSHFPKLPFVFDRGVGQ
jgi:hypothetical protein